MCLAFVNQGAEETGLCSCATWAFSHILGKLHNHKEKRNFGLGVCLNHFHIKESCSLMQKCFQNYQIPSDFCVLKRSFIVLQWENKFKPQHLCWDGFLGNCLVFPQAAFALHWWHSQSSAGKTCQNQRKWQEQMWSKLNLVPSNEGLPAEASQRAAHLLCSRREQDFVQSVNKYGCSKGILHPYYHFQSQRKRINEGNAGNCPG